MQLRSSSSYSPVVWKHRTNAGRVVYDRPKHTFRHSDAARILATLSPVTLLDSTKEAIDQQLVLLLALRNVASGGAIFAARVLSQIYLGELLPGGLGFLVDAVEGLFQGLVDLGAPATRRSLWTVPIVPGILGDVTVRNRIHIEETMNRVREVIDAYQ